MNPHQSPAPPIESVLQDEEPTPLSANVSTLLPCPPIVAAEYRHDIEKTKMLQRPGQGVRSFVTTPAVKRPPWKPAPNSHRENGL